MASRLAWDFELGILGFQRFDLFRQFLGSANVEHRDGVVIHAFQVQALLAVDEHFIAKGLFRSLP